MTEPGVPNPKDDSSSNDGYAADANPYRQPSYDQDNPYRSPSSPAGNNYPPAPPAPSAMPGQGYGQPDYSQHGYPNSPYAGQPANAPYGYPPVVNPEGKSKADYALIFGIVGVFFFSLVFGILAVIYAKRAEELGVDAKAGKILGWVDIGIGVLTVPWMLLFIPFMFMGANSSGY